MKHLGENIGVTGHGYHLGRRWERCNEKHCLICFDHGQVEERCMGCLKGSKYVQQIL